MSAFVVCDTLNISAAFVPTSSIVCRYGSNSDNPIRGGHNGRRDFDKQQHLPGRRLNG